MTLPALAVTGATGRLGGLVARHLADAGVAQRMLVRTPERAPELPGATAVRCSYEDTAASRAALADVEVLFLVSASESADRLERHRAMIDAAAAAGVNHIVYLSFVGASADATFTLARDHGATEQHIRDTGLAFTFLRDNFYAELFPATVGDDDVIRGPAGKGRVACVSLADAARAAAAVLRHPADHIGATYDLTGPAALTLTEIAAEIAAATGRPVRFHDETVDEAYRSRRAWDAPDWQYDAWVSTYTAIRAGELAAVSGDIERLTGRAPESFREFLARTV